MLNPLFVILLIEYVCVIGKTKRRSRLRLQLNARLCLNGRLPVFIKRRRNISLGVLLVSLNVKFSGGHNHQVDAGGEQLRNFDSGQHDKTRPREQRSAVLSRPLKQRARYPPAHHA
jgi:hypothetical protein